MTIGAAHRHELERASTIDQAVACINADLGQLTADDLGWTPAPATWPSLRGVLAIAIEVLPTLDDDLAADLVEHLACAIFDAEDELRVVRAVLSEALALSHAQHIEIVRLRTRLAGQLDERQRAQTVVA